MSTKAKWWTAVAAVVTCIVIVVVACLIPILFPSRVSGTIESKTYHDGHCEESFGRYSRGYECYLPDYEIKLSHVSGGIKDTFYVSHEFYAEHHVGEKATITKDDQVARRQTDDRDSITTR